MARRGRKPTPKSLKLLRGNPGKRRIPDQPEPRTAIPSAPAFLDPEGRKEWRRIAPHLKRLSLISHIDRALLAAYADLWSRYVRLTQELRTEGDVYESSSGLVKTNPKAHLLARTVAELRLVASEFGMSPSSRCRLRADEPQPADRLERFLVESA